MSSSVQSLPAGGGHRHFSARPLWAAIAVLGVAVLALGASLVHVQTRPTDGHAVFATADPLLELVAEQEADSALAVTTVAPGETVVAPSPRRAAAAAPKALPAAPAAPQATIAPGPSTPPPATPSPVAVATPAALPAAAPAPYVVTESGVVREPGPVPADPAAQRSVCAGCGRVEAVTPIARKGQAQGAGAVAGGVLGAVVGNQIGKGDGRAIATILGAVGGGVAGHALEKNTRASIVYLVQVRMDDGSLRQVELAAAPALGAAVVVDGVSLRSEDGAQVYSTGGDHAPAAAAPGAKVYSTERN